MWYIHGFNNNGFNSNISNLSIYIIVILCSGPVSRLHASAHPYTTTTIQSSPHPALLLPPTIFICPLGAGGVSSPAPPHTTTTSSPVALAHFRWRHFNVFVNMRGFQQLYVAVFLGLAGDGQ